MICSVFRSVSLDFQSFVFKWQREVILGIFVSIYLINRNLFANTKNESGSVYSGLKLVSWNLCFST